MDRNAFAALVAKQQPRTTNAPVPTVMSVLDKTESPELHGDLVRYKRDFRKWRKELDNRLVSPDIISFEWVAGVTAPTNPARVNMLNTHYFVLDSIRAFAINMPLVAGVNIFSVPLVTFNIRGSNDTKLLFQAPLNISSLISTAAGPQLTTTNPIEWEAIRVFQPGEDIDLLVNQAAGWAGDDIYFGVILVGSLISKSSNLLG